MIIDTISNVQKDKVKICVMVLSYNHLHITKIFLRSFFPNTDMDVCGLVILDNGSEKSNTDFFRDHINQYKNTVICFSDINNGVICGRNILYKEALKFFDFEYALFMDNDQIVSEGWIEDYMPKLDQYDAVGVDAWRMNDQCRPVHNVTRSGDFYTYIGAGGMIVKKHVIDNIGLFDERYEKMYFEDPDFCFSMIDNIR